MTNMLQCVFFFFNDTATTEIYTLSLHDALPIWKAEVGLPRLHSRPTQYAGRRLRFITARILMPLGLISSGRSEEHTSELQSQSNLVCRLLLEKKKRRN